MTFTDEATWYASLATMYGTPAALIMSPSGEVLLVKPNYRALWSLSARDCGAADGGFAAGGAVYVPGSPAEVAPWE